jgi:hypothetical protein
MIGEQKIRKARKDHICTEHSYHKIAKGDKYLFVSAPPWHEVANGKKWIVIRACLRCADKYGLHTSDTRAASSSVKQLAAVDAQAAT